MLKRSCWTALLLFGLWHGVQAQPSDPRYMESLARQALVERLQPMLADPSAVARLKASLEKPPLHYLDEIERLVALNVLARLLPDPALQERLVKSGHWVEDCFATAEHGRGPASSPGS